MGCGSSKDEAVSSTSKTVSKSPTVLRVNGVSSNENNEVPSKNSNYRNVDNDVTNDRPQAGGNSFDKLEMASSCNSHDERRSSRTSSFIDPHQPHDYDQPQVGVLTPHSKRSNEDSENHVGTTSSSAENHHAVDIIRPEIGSLKVSMSSSENSFDGVQEFMHNSASDHDELGWRKKKERIYTKAFHDIDINESGTIDASEFRLLIKHLNWLMTEEEISEAMKYLDVHGNGTISLQDFLEFSNFSWDKRITKGKDEFNLTLSRSDMQLMHTSKSEVILEDSMENKFNEEHNDNIKFKIYEDAFNSMDKEGKGSIGRDDLKGVFEQINWDSSDKNIQEALSFLDKDLSGTIELDEFLRWSDFAWKNRVSSGKGDDSHTKKRTIKVLSKRVSMINENNEEEYEDYYTDEEILEEEEPE